MGGGTARAGLLLLLAAAGVSAASASCACVLVAAGEAACAPAAPGGGEDPPWAGAGVRRLRVAGCPPGAAPWLRATGTLANLAELDLAGNRLSTARKSWFAGLRHLRALDLSRNLITDDEDDGDGEASFQPLTSLRRLGLAGNRLTRPPRGFLRGLAQLRDLDLSANSVQSLGDGAFAGLANLQSLDLGANALRGLASASFHGLDRLQRLHLQSNRIESLGDDVFSALRALLFLNLSGNSLALLGERSFVGLTRLQTLDVSRNALSAVSPGTLQPLSGLAELLMTGNPLQPGLMVAGTRLTTVEAARAGLVFVPASLTRSVRVLRLAGNVVSAVRCGDLDGYPLLHTLDLAGNRVADVEDDALGRLELLSTLLLQDNRLPEIPRSLPAGLLTLVLQGNPIRRVFAGDLQGIPKLRQLSLRRCLVEDIAGGAFGQLLSLQELDLSENPVKSLHSNSLAGPVGLKVLRLSQLQDLKDTPQDDAEMSFPFGSPEHLEVLELDGSPLLARQLLLDTAALAAFRGLQELNLEHDQLTSLRFDLLHFLPRLMVLRLAGNSWDCQADLLWLSEWLRRNPPAQAGPTCAQPQRLASVPIATLQDGDFEGDARYGPVSDPGRTPFAITSIADATSPTTQRQETFDIVTYSSSYASGSIMSTTPQVHSKPSGINHNVTHSHTTINRFLQILQANTPSPNISSTSEYEINTAVEKLASRQHPFNIVLISNTSSLKPSNFSHNHFQSLENQNNPNTLNVTSHIKVIQSDNVNMYTISPLGHDQSHLLKTNKAMIQAQPYSAGLRENYQLKPRDYNQSTISDSMEQEHTKNVKNESSQNYPNMHFSQHTKTISSNPTYFSHDQEHIVTNVSTFYNSLRDGLKINLSIFEKSVTENGVSNKLALKHVHSLNDELVMANNIQSNKTDDLFFMQGDDPNKNSQSTLTRPISGGTSNKNDVATSFPTEDAKPTSFHNNKPTSSDNSNDAVNSKMTKTLFSNLEYQNSSTNSTGSITQNTSAGTLLTHIQLPATENVTSLPEEHGNAAFFSNDAFSSHVHVEGVDQGGMFHTSRSHPGMFVFVVVGILMAVALATTLSHCAKRRRQTVVEYSRQQDIEVRSISSIGDIW